MKIISHVGADADVAAQIKGHRARHLLSSADVRAMYNLADQGIVHPFCVIRATLSNGCVLTLVEIVKMLELTPDAELEAHCRHAFPYAFDALCHTEI